MDESKRMFYKPSRNMDKNNSPNIHSTDSTGNTSNNKYKNDCSVVSRLDPMFSREMSVQAHFTFGPQSSAIPNRLCIQPPALSSSSSPGHSVVCPDKGKVLCNTNRHFCWSGDDGSRCSFYYNPQGLTLSYNTNDQLLQQHAQTFHGFSGHNISLTRPNAANSFQSSSENQRTKDRNFESMPLRSLTFCGSQDKAKVTPKQYGRRCKSTAHIVLQQNNATKTANVPHEFHELPHRDYTKPKEKSIKSEALKGSQTRPSREKVKMKRIPEEQHLCDCGRNIDLSSMCSCHHCTLQHNIPSCHHCHCNLSCHSHDHHPPHENFCTDCQCSRHFHRCNRTDRTHNCGPSPSSSQQERRKCTNSTTFNSHRCYVDGRCHPKVSSHRSRQDSPAARTFSDTMPDFDQFDRELPQDRKDCGPRLPRVGVSYPSRQEDSRSDSRRSRAKARPRTIHIDVYCSTSSSDEEHSISHLSSDDSCSGGADLKKRSRTLVALGSKSRPKNQVDLSKNSADKIPILGSEKKKNEAVGYQAYEKLEIGRNSRPSAFITDIPQPLSSSPSQTNTQEASRISRSETQTTTSSSTATKILSPRKEQRVIPQNITSNTSPPVRPTTLNIPNLTSPGVKSFSDQKDQSLKDSASLSYASSPFDLSVWEHDPDIPSSALSWRGSEFDASLSHMTSDVESTIRGESVPRSDVFYEGDSEGTEVESNASSLPKFWRSPQLERRRYIQKGQEDRYREAIKKRSEKAQDDANEDSDDVDALSKLSVFKNFSTDELEVISKSLNKKESGCAKTKGSTFKAIEREESIKLIKRMSSLTASFKDSSGLSSKSSSFKHDDCDVDFDRKHRVQRSSSLQSRSSSGSQTNKTLHSLDDNAIDSKDTRFCQISSVASPLSISLQGIPREMSEVSATEIPKCSTLISSSSSTNIFHPPSVPTTIAGRLINVGVYRNLNRFPFHETVPVTSSSSCMSTSWPHNHYNQTSNRAAGNSRQSSAAERRWFSPSERMFVRPQMFGEVLRSQKRHRPIHFGPPRNPQCICETCSPNLFADFSRGRGAGVRGERGGGLTSVFGSDVAAAGGSAGVIPVSSIRAAWSLSDLGPGSMLSPPLPSSSLPSSLTHNDPPPPHNDVSARPQIGTAETRGE